MLDVTEGLKIAGAALGVIAFIWRVRDEVSTFLQIDVKASVDGEGNASVLTTVENKSSFRKYLKNAVLLVGPEAESPIDTFNQIATEYGYGPVGSTNEIAEVDLNSKLSTNDRVIIPLDFYYSENLAIGDECLTFRAIIPKAKLGSGKSYAVRFFLNPKRGYHRSTHDAFTMPSRS
ncbi:MAG: hypothetical protein ABF335_04465 [Alphaproteobacteria bacterium]